MRQYTLAIRINKFLESKIFPTVVTNVKTCLSSYMAKNKSSKSLHTVRNHLMFTSVVESILLLQHYIFIPSLLSSPVTACIAQSEKHIISSFHHSDGRSLKTAYSAGNKIRNFWLKWVKIY